MELKDVVIKAQNGDSKAFAALFEQTQKMVYFNALKFTGNESAAEDLTQDVYIKAMENLASLKVPEAFVGWLRQITVNVCKNYLASRKPTVLGSDENDEMLANLPEVDEDFIPHEYADNKETCRLIMAMVDSLPENQRVAVILYYYNELPISRIAELLHISENTVKSRLNYARRQIKEQVEDLEKKGTKLHAVPVLGLILKNAAEEYSLSASAASAIISSLTATVATTATATASTAAGGGLIAKIAAMPLVTKVVAGVLGAAIAIGAAVGITASISNDENEQGTQIEAVKLDSNMAEAFAKLDMATFLDKPLEEAIACFGDEYTVESYESGEGYISYKFSYGDKWDYLILMYTADENGNDVVNSISLLGDVLNYKGLNISKTPEEARKILTQNGFEIAHSSEDDYNQEIYVNPNESFHVFFMYQGDDIVNVTLESMNDYYAGEEDFGAKYDAIITSGDFVIATYGDEATVVDYTGYGVNVVIPAAIEGYKVTAIDTVWDYESNTEYNAFANSDFESIIIPEGVERIGVYAFKHCDNMKSIDLPDSLKEVGNSAFAWCGKLDNVVVPSGIEVLDECVFAACADLKNVTLPKGLKTICEGAFFECYDLETVEIPNSVTSIEENAFYECIRLKNIKFPSKITTIANGVFEGCEALESFEIPAGVTSIGDGAFFECDSLVSITVPSKVKSIGEGAFGKCYSLTSVSLPESLEYIGGSAFGYCEALENFEIPAGVTSIGENSPFAACTALKNLTVNKGNKHFVIGDDGELYNKNKSTLIYVPYALESFEIPKSVTKIGSGAFFDLDNLESIVVPNGVTEIGMNAFANSSYLEKVELPKSVKTIGENAFTNCHKLCIECYEGSFAAEYAATNGITVEYIK